MVMTKVSSFVLGAYLLGSVTCVRMDGNILAESLMNEDMAEEGEDNKKAVNMEGDSNEKARAKKALVEEIGDSDARGSVDLSLVTVVQDRHDFGNVTRFTTHKLEPIARPEINISAEVAGGCYPGPEARDGNIWEKTGKVLGQGANGQVLEVKRYEHHPRYHRQTYALKLPLTDYGKSDVIQEARILASTRCGGVMQLTDAQPCLYPEKNPLPASYVSPMMAGDLQGWLDKNRLFSVRQSCAVKIHAELMPGLDCFHGRAEANGWIHNDLKPDNIFFDHYDEAGCPAGLKLADFGRSYRMNTYGDRASGHEWKRCWHLPRITFQLQGNSTRFVARPEVDWCSYIFMMYFDFNYHVGRSVSSYIHQSFDCGNFGPNRDVHIRY